MGPAGDFNIKETYKKLLDQVNAENYQDIFNPFNFGIEEDDLGKKTLDEIVTTAETYVENLGDIDQVMEIVNKETEIRLKDLGVEDENIKNIVNDVQSKLSDKLASLRSNLT